MIYSIKDKKELLRVKNLKAYLNTKDGIRKIVDGIDLKIYEGTTHGLTGETGSGKTVTAFAILRLLEPITSVYPKWNVEGEVLYKGINLLKLSEEEMCEIRGNEIALIPQNPIPSLNPLDIIGYQTGEPVEVHKKIRWEKIKGMVKDYLGKVKLPDARKRFWSFPDEFSGGEGQRIMIAMALINDPPLLIADEPTSSLDVTIQRQVLELIEGMKKEFNLSMLYITHDIAVIAEMADYVSVIYGGKIMEYGDVLSIFKRPKHPYTRGILAAVPRIDVKRKLKSIPGVSPNPLHPPPGCRFHPRCAYVKNICRVEEPKMTEIGPDHSVSCWLYETQTLMTG